VTLGLMAGLFAGKQAGVLLATSIAFKSKLALPDHAN